jgi:hypothetical protein
MKLSAKPKPGTIKGEVSSSLRPLDEPFDKLRTGLGTRQARDDASSGHRLQAQDSALEGALLLQPRAFAGPKALVVQSDLDRLNGLLKLTLGFG